VATDLTADKLDRQQEGRRLDAGVPALVGREGQGDTSGRPYQA
jgi:hypothetical protein